MKGDHPVSWTAFDRPGLDGPVDAKGTRHGHAGLRVFLPPNRLHTLGASPLDGLRQCNDELGLCKTDRSNLDADARVLLKVDPSALARCQSWQLRPSSAAHHCAAATEAARRSRSASP